MRLKASALVVAVILATTLVGPVVSAKPFDGGSDFTECNVHGTVTWSPAKLWPPNHKMKTVTLSFDESENDGDTIGLEVDSITHSEEGSEKGSTAKFEPDSTGVGASDTGVDTVDPTTPDPAVVTIQLRSERMGQSRDGRTYTIGVTCSDEGNVSGAGLHFDTATLDVVVPHDRRK